ncbi:MAG: carboxypeptidase M32 [Caldilineae bacterium]|nr:carboxypeptidase M32 [Anaerolineae bacterium]MCB0203484.1 carboxypeptidase M32 [Anaerolineae bacterium]MCB9152487.1 carboxypeptidase M32 [Caldilineae bacterium]
MNDKLTELKSRLREASDFNSAASVLYWDQTTYMPPGGAEARGRQIAALQKLAQERFTDPAIGRLLDDLQPYQESLPYDDDDASLLRVTRRDYERQTRLPAQFVGEMAEHSIASYQTWIKARPANDFAAVAPVLEKTLELSRRYADYFPGYGHIADPLIDESDPGMTVAVLRPLFKALREQLVPLVDAIAAQPVPDDSFIYRDYVEQQQWDFGVDIVRHYGYDFERGRQDKTHHPYMIRFSAGDVRITTRFSRNNLVDGLFSTLHEAGHAMYEQGVAQEYDATPLGHGTSSGVHESQSRLWENVVGRSQPFWSYYYPRLQAVFPAQLGDVSEGAFYRAINLVRPSLIRVDADEVTYNLHVIIRFELELALLEGKLAIGDLPDAWQASYQESLGIQAPDNRDGVLQDVHWYSGLIGGAFQGYTLGNIMGAAFWQAALRANPGVMDDIAQGEFAALHGWLRDNLYRYGRKFTADELIERVTGAPLTIDPYIAYLRGKFGELYGINGS